MAHKRKASPLTKDGSEPADSEGSEDELNNVSDETEIKLESRSGTKEWVPIPLTQAQQMATSKSALLGLMTLAVSRAALPQAATVTTASAAAAAAAVSRGSPCPASPVGSEQGATGTPRDNASNPEDTSSNGNKDDEDDEADDDNDDDKIDAHHDPERMKSFNMFVRLFVDENLDRIVPISKQPKEKIQAIIDACGRQFPEFAERTRKRIRTYLKSCRRNKRTRDSNGLDTSSRPTPPHLTSIQAEQILASACENEAQNAKRMRLGLEPIAQPNPLTQHMQLQQASNDKPLSMVELRVKTEPTPSSHTSVLAKALERPLDQSLSEGKVMNGSSMFQASYQQNFQKMSSLTGSTVHSQPSITPLLQTTSSGVVSNGPTDLSVKSVPTKVVRPSLNIVEVASVRQLITGYRESAAFLLRSADELENLLVHHQAPK